MPDNEKCKTYEQNKLLDLTSEYYNLPEKDKIYICKYYRSLVDDLFQVTLHVKRVVNEEDESGIIEEAGFDFQEFFIEKRDYAVKTIAHMITLLDFAAAFCVSVREIPEKDKIYNSEYYYSMSEAEKRKEKICAHTELFIEQLGEEFREELWDNLMIDMAKIMPLCRRSYAQNLNMTIQSVRRDYPDFVKDVKFC